GWGAPGRGEDPHGEPPPPPDPPPEAALVLVRHQERGSSPGELRSLVVRQRRRLSSLQLLLVLRQLVELLLEPVARLARVACGGRGLTSQRLGGDGEVPELLGHVLAILGQLGRRVLLGALLPLRVRVGPGCLLL